MNKTKNEKECLTKGNALITCNHKQWKDWVHKRFEGVYKGDDCIAFIRLLELFRNGESQSYILHTMAMQGHSGGSYTMVMHLAKVFCPELYEIIKKEKA